MKFNFTCRTVISSPILGAPYGMSTKVGSCSAHEVAELLAHFKTDHDLQYGITVKVIRGYINDQNRAPFSILNEFLRYDGTVLGESISPFFFRIRSDELMAFPDGTIGDINTGVIQGNLTWRFLHENGT